MGRGLVARDAVRSVLHGVVRVTAAAAAAALLVLPTAGPAAATPTTPTAPTTPTTPTAPTPPTVATPSTPAVPAPTPPGPPAVPAKPPKCANAIQVVVGTQTSPPTPLPRPTSAVGGGTLSAPGLQVSVRPGMAQPPVLPAAAWVVADSVTGAVVASCNAHVPFMPASTLKILTALALESTVPPKSTYVALPADAQADGTKVGLSPGSTYTGDDLWHGLLMSSGNDAAHALADLAGGPTAAAELMTAEARRLGALDTVPVNTSGLDAPGQVTSAYDLALLGRAALARPYLAKVMTTRVYAFPGKGIGSGKARPRFQIQNHNRLLGSYAGATGVKNGYTVKAGGSFVGAATRGDRSYVVTVLRADGRTSEMARKLLDWAFTNGATAQPVGRLVTPEDVAAGRLGDGGAPGATPTQGSTTGSTTDSTTGGVTAPPTPAPQSGPTLRTDSTTAGSTADAWAAGVVLGAVGAFGLVSAVLVLRRARQRQLAGDTIVPGLLLRRLGSRGAFVGATGAGADDAGAGTAGAGLVGAGSAGAGSAGAGATGETASDAKAPDGKTPDAQTPDAKNSDAQNPDEKPPAEQPTAEQPTPEQPTAEQPTPEQPTPEQPTPEQPTPEQPPAPTADTSPGKAFPELEGLGLSEPRPTRD